MSNTAHEAMLSLMPDDEIEMRSTLIRRELDRRESEGEAYDPEVRVTIGAPTPVLERALADLETERAGRLA